MSVIPNAGLNPRGWYLALWRWHFYAALIVVPFLMLVSVTGGLMLLKGPLEDLLYGELLYVESAGPSQSVTRQLAAVEAQYPHHSVTLFIPPATARHSSEFSLVSGHGHGAGAGHSSHSAASLSVYVNPYSGEILGQLDPATTFYAWTKALHGSLLLGDSGDLVLEIVASLAVLMVISGLCLAWFRLSGRQQADARDFQLRLSTRHRGDWRSLHLTTGLLAAVPLLFFLLSGLAWTSVWGGKLVQAWSSLPGTSFTAPVSDRNHESLNRTGHREVPWTLEQTPLPRSAAITASEVTLESIVTRAHEMGFGRFRVNVPRAPDAVWTISASTIAGDLTDPRLERTVHIDRHSGAVLADLRFPDYPLLGKAMAAGIPLHQGDLGLWNLLLNIAVCVLVFSLAGAGALTWWLRRPPGQMRLHPPPIAVEPRTRWGVFVLMLLLAVLLPLAAATILVVAVLDWLVVQRVPQLQRIFN